MKLKEIKYFAIALCICICMAIAGTFVLTYVPEPAQKIILLEGEEQQITSSNYSIILRDIMPYRPGAGKRATIEICRDSEFITRKIIPTYSDCDSAKINGIKIRLWDVSSKSAEFWIYKE